MKISPRPKTIQEYQNYLLRLYGDSNKERGSDYLYGYLSRSTAYLGKNLSVEKATDQHFFRSLSWLYALANFYELDLQTSLFSRFPDICPYCITTPCICFRTKKSPAKPKAAYKIKEEIDAKYNVLARSTHDWSLGSAIKKLSIIYPNNEVIWHHAGPWYLIAKMQEEVGELHEAISKYEIGRKPKSAISEELSDTFAWLLSAWGIVFRGRSIDDAFLDYFDNDCPVCTSFPCKCSERADRAAELVDLKTLENIQDNLGKLEDILPTANESLRELKKSIAAATADQSEPTTVHALKETKGTLKKIRDGLSTADDIGKKGVSIINSIFQLLDKIPGP